MTDLDPPQGEQPWDDWNGTDFRWLQKQISDLESEILDKQWKVRLYAMFGDLHQDQRFQRLLKGMADHRQTVLEHLAAEPSLTPQRLGRLQGQAWALAFFRDTATMDPKEVEEAKRTLPGLQAQVDYKKSLLHGPEPGAEDLGSG